MSKILYYVCCGIIYILCFIACVVAGYRISHGNPEGMFGFYILFAPICNIFGFGIVCCKYIRHPEREIKNSTNDIFLLYNCRIMGCLFIGTLIPFSTKGHVDESFLGWAFIIYLLTPTVKGTVNFLVKHSHAKTKRFESNQEFTNNIQNDVSNKPIEKTCPTCGTKTEHDAIYCEKCGTKIE